MAGVTQHSHLLQSHIEELEVIFDNVPALISYVDAHEVYRRVNHAYEEFFSTSRDNIVGKTVRQMLGEEQYVISKPYIDRVLAGERVCFERQAVNVKGSIRDLALTYTPDFDARGKVRGFIVLVQDITANRQAEMRARHAGEQLRALISASPLAIVALTADGNITLWNPAAERVFGWTETEVLGKSLPFIPEDKLAEHHTMRARDLSGEGFTGCEVRRRRKDGSPIDISVSTAPMRDASGRIIGIMSIYVDVTERRAAEEALRKANQELEEFAYVASHDLQEPLRTINIYSQLLIRRYAPQGGEPAKFSGFIETAVTRMQRLIHDLLGYSRAIHEPLELIRGGRQANLQSAFDDALASLRGRVQETRAVVTCSALPQVRGDEAQLEQVFQNLLSNALKYCKSGVTPEVIISAELQGSMWTITVRDNGIGFHPQYSERIFGLFRRLHRDAYPGTGLGLAICKRIVERHGGRIWAESSPGQGAAFRFTLPA